MPCLGALHHLHGRMRMHPQLQGQPETLNLQLVDQQLLPRPRTNFALVGKIWPQPLKSIIIDPLNRRKSEIRYTKCGLSQSKKSNSVCKCPYDHWFSTHGVSDCLVHAFKRSEYVWPSLNSTTRLRHSGTQAWKNHVWELLSSWYWFLFTVWRLCNTRKHQKKAEFKQTLGVQQPMGFSNPPAHPGLEAEGWKCLWPVLFSILDNSSFLHTV